MSKESEDRDKLKLFIEGQTSEAQLHWSRNSYFLVVMSILILAFGQTLVGNLSQLAWFRILISILGMGMSIVWLLIQDRSSRYIGYYKKQAQELAAPTRINMYPSLPGLEMRLLAYSLPIMFFVIWLVFFGVVVNLYFLPTNSLPIMFFVIWLVFFGVV
jgi:hypothetical protein